MACHIDDVIGAAHHEDVPVLVDKPRVGGQVVTGMAGQVGVDPALIAAPQRRRTPRRERQRDADVAGHAGCHPFTRLVQHAHVVAGHRHRRPTRP